MPKIWCSVGSIRLTIVDATRSLDLVLRDLYKTSGKYNTNFAILL